MAETHVTRLINSARRFRRVSELLAGSKGRPVAIQQLEENLEESEHFSRIAYAIVRSYLYAIIVELSIKAIWSFEKEGNEPEYTHDIIKLFRQLKRETQIRIEEIYGTLQIQYNYYLSHMKEHHGKEDFFKHVKIATTVEEAFEWNKVAITEHKYDLIIDGRTVPCGSLYGLTGKQVIILPTPKLSDFSYDLLDFVERQTNTKNMTLHNKGPLPYNFDPISIGH